MGALKRDVIMYKGVREMKIIVKNLNLKKFVFIDIRSVDEKYIEDIKKAANTFKIVDIEEVANDEVVGETNLIVISRLECAFSDGMNYFIGEVYGRFEIENMKMDEFDKEENVDEFRKIAVKALNDKFKLFVGMTSQEVYAGPIMLERKEFKITDELV